MAFSIEGLTTGVTWTILLTMPLTFCALIVRCVAVYGESQSSHQNYLHFCLEDERMSCVCRMS